MLPSQWTINPYTYTCLSKQDQPKHANDHRSQKRIHPRTAKSVYENRADLYCINGFCVSCIWTTCKGGNKTLKITVEFNQQLESLSKVQFALNTESKYSLNCIYMIFGMFILTPSYHVSHKTPYL